MNRKAENPKPQTNHRRKRAQTNRLKYRQVTKTVEAHHNHHRK